MARKILICLMCITLLFAAAACGDGKEEKAKEEKAKQEEIQQENEAAANAVISSIESLPDEQDLTLKDVPAVDGARAIYDELTDDQKKLVPADKLTKLESAERRVQELNYEEEERQKNKQTDQKKSFHVFFLLKSESRAGSSDSAPAAIAGSKPM